MAAAFLIALDPASLSPRSRRGLAWLAVALLGALGCFTCGCSRRIHREAADDDAYETIAAATDDRPWRPPVGFTIEPDPRSRFAALGDPDDPPLPDPGPTLHGYALPAPSAAGAPPASAAPAAARDSPGQPIPKSYWDALPRRALARMLEFESVSDEYARELRSSQPPELLDRSPRYSLEGLVALARINSREEQAAKEALYAAALAVGLERFAYSVKLTPAGNGTTADVTHTRADGESQHQVNVASGLSIDRMLATGGTLLARFANTVVLTFNGPEGFASDIGSELLINIQQTLFQSDAQLEPLVASERGLVYAARQYTRFRAEFFVNLAGEYYALLRSFRALEIESQNYFSLVRTFEQARAEVRAGVRNAPNLVAVDQFEQSMLSGRSSLIAASNRLEAGLDRLKLTLGVPTEAALSLDLAELERLTLRDQIEVAAERVRRWRLVLDERRAQARVEASDILNGSIYLIERLLEWVRLRRRLGDDRGLDSSPLETRLYELRVEERRLEVERQRSEMEASRAVAARTPAVVVFSRLSELLRALDDLARRQLELAEKLGRPTDSLTPLTSEREERSRQLEALRQRLAEVVQDPREEALRELLEQAGRIEAALEALVRTADGLAGAGAVRLGVGAAEDLARVVDDILARSDALLRVDDGGLPAMGIDVDEAMATGLVQRLDLMNERGRLADRWREVKLAADDLRTIVNLDASFAARTREGKPFRFTADESVARAAITVDLPLNRREKRSGYRLALIGFEAARRSLMAFEDDIKSDVRDELRRLEESRIQYPISVTQAALAAEQVLSVRLQLALGVQGVRGTDLLDALQSSRQSLIAVANSRIGFIVDRSRLALDLGGLDLNELGGWQWISDPSWRPQPNITPPANAGPAYGELPAGILLSDDIERLVEPAAAGSPLEERAPDR